MGRTDVRKSSCFLLVLLPLAVCSLLSLVDAIPSSLIQQIKDSEVRDSKVKRARSTDGLTSEENEADISYYSNPSATKRGVNLADVSPVATGNSVAENWNNPDENPLAYRDRKSGDEMDMDVDKGLAEYEKGLRYDGEKLALDEALENAVLKSELYGEPGSINPYRYYGGEDRKRKRRNVRKLRLDARMKRDVDLSPEEILALLSLYESNKQSDNYRHPWNRYNEDLDLDLNQDNIQDQSGDENWLDNPVNPHVSGYDADLGPKYRMDANLPPVYDDGDKWDEGYGNTKKRFMVSKKRSMDPTRELRYLNGPNKNDFYSLSQLLSHQREPNVPVYRRLIL